ncbi:hypothetical protein GN958_ATG21044 [Phytophthora infestans]|uniref:Uncharacterized protein n=1 Tax=Phytophthora infestans TaxID=4787 RepID=A0A8S9TLC7_PHYIN|nr:hypothetical protein GN958_ATG21044 [Phytophthora infestans]
MIGGQNDNREEGRHERPRASEEGGVWTSEEGDRPTCSRDADGGAGHDAVNAVPDACHDGTINDDAVNNHSDDTMVVTPSKTTTDTTVATDRDMRLGQYLVPTRSDTAAVRLAKKLAKRDAKRQRVEHAV